MKSPIRGTVVLLTALVLGACAERPAAPPADDVPQRIVSLSPSATEALYAVGAGPQVVAVDDQSTYPEQAPRTKLSGLTPSPEQIAKHDPDLVVVSADVDKLSAALDKLGIETLVLPDAPTLEDAYGQFRKLGEVTGHADEGRDVAARVKRDIAKVVKDTDLPKRKLSYYHEVDQTFYTATSATFIGEVYSLFGLRNIADGDDPKANGGYPQLSAEKIIKANPDLIFLADTKCCGQNLQAVAKRPGWRTLTAVKQRRVIALDDSIASRWSPRVVDLVRTVADAVEAAG